MQEQASGQGQVGSSGPPLDVRLLGGLVARDADGLISLPRSARLATLLAWLLLRRDAPQARPVLAARLWPESSEAQARTNLRHLLHSMRQALPIADRWIDIQPDTLQWRPGTTVSVDVEVFLQALDEGRVGDALRAYRGDLLAGIWDDWVVEERDRLAGLHREALAQHAATLATDHRWLEALRHAERLVQLDPVSDHAHRLLIRIARDAGDRARALRAYHACAAVLRDELGVDPSPATRQLYDGLLLDTAPPAGLPARTGPPAPPQGPPLVGRRNERAAVSHAWDRAVAGRPQFVLVTGEPGVGKSRLIDEIRTRVLPDGTALAVARGWPGEDALAYGLVTAWLRNIDVVERADEFSRHHLAELARLLPGLADRVADLPTPPAPDADEQRARLFDAVSHTLLRRQPLVLIADDLHWADASSLQVLQHLLRTEGSHLLVLGTARQEEVDRDHPLELLVAATRAQGTATELPLERLGRDEIHELATHVVGRPLPVADLDRLHDRSEGNPLFAIELLHLQHGASVPDARDVADRVQGVIAQRLGQLSRSAFELAGLAATVGRDFSVTVLADASPLGEDTFVQALDELWRRGLVRTRDAVSYDFTHDRIREAAYAALGPALVRHHHRRVASALMRAASTDLDSSTGRIARHHDRAGDPYAAITWYLRAAESAQRVHASTDAVQFLERARALVADLPVTADRNRLELRVLSALPAPLVAVEGYLSARVADIHARAITLSNAHGSGLSPPLARSLAMAALTRGEFAAARPFGLQLRERADRDGDDVLWVESAYVLGVAAFWQGHLVEARDEFAAAVARSRPDHAHHHMVRYGQDPLAFCGLRLAYTLWLLGDDDGADAARDAALQRARTCGHPFTHRSTLAWAALLALDRHDDAEERMLVGQLMDNPEPRDARPLARFIEALDCHVAVLDGRSEGGLATVPTTARDARADPPTAPGVTAMHQRILLEICARSLDATAGLQVSDTSLASGLGNQLWEAETRRLRAQFLDALGFSGRATTELDQALVVARRQAAVAVERRILADLAERGEDRTEEQVVERPRNAPTG